MLTLHEYTPSQNCWKVRVLLGLLGIPYRSQPVAIFSGESRTAEFLALNPAGSTPALTLDDGRAIAESNAILCYLAEGTRYMPPANSPEGRFARAKVMQWLFFEQYYVEPVIGSLRFWTLTGRLESNAGAGGGQARCGDAGALRAGAHAAREPVPRRQRLHHRGHRELCLCAPQRRLRISAGGLSRHRALGRPGRRHHRAGLSGRPLWAGGAPRLE